MDDIHFGTLKQYNKTLCGVDCDTCHVVYAEESNPAYGLISCLDCSRMLDVRFKREEIIKTLSDEIPNK